MNAKKNKIMKPKTLLQFPICILLPAIHCLCSIGLFAQTPGEWTWMNGSDTSASAGVWGTQGVSNPANTPTYLYGAYGWTDLQGNFWLFGGLDWSDYFSDLWKFNPTSNEWTWVKGPGIPNQYGVYGSQGVPSVNNNPGARSVGSLTWTDVNGDLWLFGGYGYSATQYSLLGDLWKYEISTNEWTWMKGSSDPPYASNYGTQGISTSTNLPAATGETTCSWTDNNNNLWFFGGDINSYFKDDLWKYDISTNEWTWMRGSSLPNQLPVYGTKGIPNPANTPGGRWTYSKWKDNTGNLWLFGGARYDSLSFSSYGLSNDVWKYEITTNNWTWMYGSNVLNDTGSSATKCLPSANYLPSGRYENRACWTDDCGNLFTFAGVGGGNDLWHLNILNGEWTLVSGGTFVGQTGVYGIKTVSSPTNMPGGSCGSVSWKDMNGNLWFFNSNGLYNDLWRFVPDSTCGVTCVTFSATAEVNNIVCNGKCTGSAMATPSGGIPPYSYNWNSNPSQSTQIATGLCVGPYTVTVTDSANIIRTLTVIITQPASIIVSQNPNICFGSTYTLPSGIIVNTAGTYSDTLTSSTGCDSVFTTNLTVNPIASFAQSQNICFGNSYTLPSGTVVSAAGTYNDTIMSIAGCDSIVTTNLTITPKPNVTTSPDIILAANSSTTLSVTEGVTYQWSPSTGLSCTTCANPMASPSSTTDYCVTVTDINSCSDSACVRVIVEAPCLIGYQFTSPNAFSPNNDGHSDLFLFPELENCVTTFSFIVFDRWGEKVFETENVAKGWDGSFKGKPMNPAVFVYYINATLNNGEKITKKGNISLIR